MLFARPAHAIGPNDVRDAMRHKAGVLMRSGGSLSIPGTSGLVLTAPEEADGWQF